MPREREVTKAAIFRIASSLLENWYCGSGLNACGRGMTTQMLPNRGCCGTNCVEVAQILLHGLKPRARDGASFANGPALVSRRARDDRRSAGGSWARRSETRRVGKGGVER